MKTINPARRWEDAHHHTKVQRNIGYQLLAVVSVILIVITVAFASIFPLVRHVPIVIEVERSTGHIEVKTNLIEDIKSISEKQAVVESLLARYLISWKTFEYTDNEERVAFIKATSTREVFKQFESIWSSKDERENPYLRYGEGGKANVSILSIVQLNEVTYQARIAVNEERATRKQRKYFVAILSHKFTPVGMTQKQRWTNPLGLVIDSVRFDEEYIEN
ncbi:virB8 family protein [Marinicella sp. W31]|uniref:virB8 family protein n=1 Tax=Marinicella sp. W31 TaxID=3023713 RepID=UPI0037573DFA